MTLNLVLRSVQQLSQLASVEGRTEGLPSVFVICARLAEEDAVSEKSLRHLLHEGMLAKVLVVSSVELFNGVDVVDDHVGLEKEKTDGTFGVVQVVVVNLQRLHERVFVLAVQSWHKLPQVANERQWEARTLDAVLARVVPPGRVGFVNSEVE